MEFASRTAKPSEVTDAYVAMGVHAPEKEEWTYPAYVAQFSKEATQAIRNACEKKHFDGEPGSLHVVTVGPQSFVLSGLGKKEKADLEAIRRASAAASKRIAGLEATECASFLAQTAVRGTSPEERAEAATFGAVLGLYKYDKHFSKKNENGGKKKQRKLDKVTLIALKPDEAKALDKGIHAGLIIAVTVAEARTTANEPALQMPPRRLAEWAQEQGKKHGVKVTVLNKKQIQEHKMGGLLGVSAGSHEEPRFIVAEHKPARTKSKKWKTLAIVGKAITFDTGGISLKPGQDMDQMKFDKCGGIAALSIVFAAARLKVPLHLVACVPATENMPGGGATRPGDILYMASGKTVEVLNTDAEGRLVLGDGIWYAHKHKPDAIIDLATLTGAIEIALGKHYTGLFANDDALAQALMKAGDKTHDRLWRMPWGDEYQEQIKGDYADIKNLGGRGGGSSTAAQFLWNFIEEGVAWAHFDIAATAWVNSPTHYTPKGATGSGIPCIVQFLRDLTA